MPNVTESPAAALQSVAIDRLEWARNFTNALLAGMTDEQCMARAGGKGNHAIWVIGHLAHVDDFFLSKLTDTEMQLPENYKTLFGGGSEPTDDASAYPSKVELLEAMQASRVRLVDWVKSMDDATVRQPLPEALQPFAPDMISVPITMAAHDLFHLGQVASVRSALGLPRAMG